MKRVSREEALKLQALVTPPLFCDPDVVPAHDEERNHETEPGRDVAHPV